MNGWQHLDEHLLPPGGGSFGIMPPPKAPSRDSDSDSDSESESESESASESESESESEADDEDDAVKANESESKPATKKDVAVVVSKQKFEQVPCPSQRNEPVPAGVRLTSVDCQDLYLRTVLNADVGDGGEDLQAEEANGAASMYSGAYKQFVALGRAQLAREKKGEEDDGDVAVDESAQLHPDLPMQFGKTPNWNGQEAVVALPLQPPSPPPPAAVVAADAMAKMGLPTSFTGSIVREGAQTDLDDGELDYGEPEVFQRPKNGTAAAVANGAHVCVNGTASAALQGSDGSNGKVNKSPTLIKADLERLRELRKNLEDEIGQLRQKQASASL